MQKMMAKLNKNTSHAITQSAISEASTILQAASDRGKGKSSRISPNPASSAYGEESKDGKPKRRRLTTSKSKGHGLSVLSLASNNNYEALSFVSANLNDDSVFINRSKSEKSFKVKDASHRELLQSFKKSMGMSAATLKTRQDSKEDDGMSAAVEPRTSCNTRGSNETFESEALKSEAHARDVEETN